MAECPLTELEIDSCGCPKHRGKTEVRALKAIKDGPVFPATYESRCTVCGNDIDAGDDICHTTDDEFVHHDCTTEPLGRRSFKK